MVRVEVDKKLHDKEAYDVELVNFIKSREELGSRFSYLPADNPGDGVDATQEGCNQKDTDDMIRKFKTEAVHHLLVSPRNHETQLGFSCASSLIKATEGALMLEHQRMQNCMELIHREGSQLLVSSDTDFPLFLIANKIQRIMGTKQLIETKATELIEILNKSAPWCPRFISNSVFAQLVLNASQRRVSFYRGFAYPYAQFIVLVTSKVPHAMDFLLDELNRICIYTVPKHIEYLESAFESEEEYCKTIGYQKGKDGNLESRESFLERLGNYMSLYGALAIQRGVEEGWAFMVSLLMGLPANIYTAVGLDAFLRVAGFHLHKRYKFHFVRWLDFVCEKFLEELDMKGDQKLEEVLGRIWRYIQDEEYLVEPEGCRVGGCKAPQQVIVECLGIP